MALTVIGTKPGDTATGRERWATISVGNDDTFVTAYLGWAVTDTVRLTGRVARLLAENIANELLSPQYKETITTEALWSGPLRLGKLYSVKVNGLTIGHLTYDGKRGGLNCWRQHRPNREHVGTYVGSLKDAAKSLTQRVTPEQVAACE